MGNQGNYWLNTLKSEKLCPDVKSFEDLRQFFIDNLKDAHDMFALGKYSFDCFAAEFALWAKEQIHDKLYEGDVKLEFGYGSSREEIVDVIYRFKFKLPGDEQFYRFRLMSDSNFELRYASQIRAF